MTAQEIWKEYLMQANEWMNQRFPHFSHQILPDYSLDIYVKGLRVEFVDRLSIEGHEIDSMLDGSSLDLLKVNPRTTFPKSEKERTAIAVHEITEGYGIRSHLYHGYGFNIIRIEHDYAEFVEMYYRREQGLSRCPLELDEQDFKLMRKIDEFYRRFPIGRRYIGTILYVALLENPNLPVDENLKARVLEKCRFD